MAASSVPTLSDPVLPSLQAAAWGDLVNGLLRFELWGRIGWLDVKRRYRRTALGPFWTSATLAIYTVAVGIVGAGLFHQNIREYLPYLSSGMIVWTLISTIIIKSCNALIVGHILFRNVRFEYSILAYALVWRNFIIFLHNLVIYLAIILILKPSLFDLKMLVVIPGLFIILINGVWIALLCGMLCLRFRDIQPIVQTVISIFMLVTPIFWSADGLSGLRQFIFVQLNPLYRLIDIVRGPLLGTIPTTASYVAALVITAMGWGFAFMIFRRFRTRISYWS